MPETVIIVPCYNEAKRMVIVQAPVLIRGMVQIDLTSHLRW